MSKKFDHSKFKTHSYCCGPTIYKLKKNHVFSLFILCSWTATRTCTHSFLQMGSYVHGRFSPAIKAVNLVCVFWVGGLWGHRQVVKGCNVFTERKAMSWYKRECL